MKSLSRVCQLFAIPWTVAHQGPLSAGFSRQEYWSGFLLPSPGKQIDGSWKSQELPHDRAARASFYIWPCPSVSPLRMLLWWFPNSIMWPQWPCLLWSYAASTWTSWFSCLPWWPLRGCVPWGSASIAKEWRGWSEDLHSHSIQDLWGGARVEPTGWTWSGGHGHICFLTFGLRFPSFLFLFIGCAGV